MTFSSGHELRADIAYGPSLRQILNVSAELIGAFCRLLRFQAPVLEDTVDFMRAH